MSAGFSSSKILVFTEEVSDWGIWSLKFKASQYKDCSWFVPYLAVSALEKVWEKAKIDLD
jgi:hypothetical protein